MAKSCTAPGCTGVTVGLGLCSKHYRRMKKNGHINEFRVMNSICSHCLKKFSYEAPIRSTKKKVFCTDQCHSLYLIENKPYCNVEGCNKKALHLKGGMCSMHSTRFRIHGDLNKVLKIAKNPIGATCLVENCKSKVLSRNMCSKHWQMWKKHGDPLGGAYQIPFSKAIDHGDGTRTCTKCMARKPVSDFHKDKTATDGIRSTCKRCRIDHVKNWYQDNQARQQKRANLRRKEDPEKERLREAERYIKDREKRILLATEHSHRRKARRLKTVVEKGISKSSLKKLFGTKCFYCEKEMDFSVAIGRKFSRDMATIEHLIPLARGGEHTWENTVLACRHCNISKNAKSIEEFEEFNKDK